MARRGHGCRCCGCSFNNIFRCEQLSVNLWNQSGGLPVVTCDSAPSPGNLTAVSAWLTSGGFASGGQLSIDLDAAGLNLTASSTGSGFLQASILQSAATATSTISGAIRTISLNSDTRRAVFSQTHAMSVRSCKTSAGRFVTAYAPATPRGVSNIPELTARLVVAFRQQGEPGFTNQSIDGLRSGGSNPYWMTQACRAAVYRDGEYVDTVARDPSLCVFLPDGNATVSRTGPPAVDTDSRMAAIAALQAERSSIVPPPDPNAGVRADLIAQINSATQQINFDFFVWKDQEGLESDYYSRAGTNDECKPRLSCRIRLSDFVLLERLIDAGKIKPGNYGHSDALSLFLSGLITSAQINQQYDAHVLQLLPQFAERNAELAAKQAELNALPPPPGLTPAQINRINQINAEIELLSAGTPYDLIDYIASSDGIVRLSGYAAGRTATTSESYIGGVRMPSGQTPYVDPVASPDFADARYFFVRQGDRFRIAIGAGGYASLSIEPSGALLGTFDEATSPEGSYLVVSKYDDDCMPSWQGSANFDNLDDLWQGLGGYRVYQNEFGATITEPRRLSQRRYEFNSFVVDKTPPSIVARQVDDFVVGEWPTAINVAAADEFTGIYRVEASPLLFADEPVLGNLNRAEYVTRPAVLGDPGFYRATNAALKDRAHNFPLLMPAVEFTIHETATGAKATFSSSGDDIQRTSPLTTLDLVFDKPVVGVLKRHFTIEAYGRRDDGSLGVLDGDDGLSRINPKHITKLEWPDGKTCRITFNAATQTSGSLWRIVFQPDESVFALPDDAQRSQWSYAHTEAAPAVGGSPDRPESAMWRVFRPQSDWMNPIEWNESQKEWKWSGESENVPIPAGSESCVFAARFAWICPQENVRQLIDTSASGTFTFGSTASVSAAVAEPDPDQPPVTALASSSTVSLPASGGSFHSSHEADSFSPNAPPDPDVATSVPHSYFGMSTTIYPSPAKRLSLCAAPLEPQKHFSAMMAANNFTTITASMNTHVPVNGRTYAGNLVVPDRTGRPHAQFSTNWEEIGAIREPDREDWLPPFLTRWFFGPFAMSPVDGGASRSQNQWAASLGTQTVGSFYGIVWNPPEFGDRESFPPFDFRRDNIGSMTVSIGAILVATRVVQEYTGIATAVPGDLFLSMRVTASANISATKRQRIPGEPDKSENVFYQAWRSYTGNYEVAFHLSKAQEYALASGNAVQIVVANTSTKTSPVPDPNSSIPGFIQDINRHVWTLQAS